jgi:hypothetical protein
MSHLTADFTIKNTLNLKIPLMKKVDSVVYYALVNL